MLLKCGDIYDDIISFGRPKYYTLERRGHDNVCGAVFEGCS